LIQRLAEFEFKMMQIEIIYLSFENEMMRAVEQRRSKYK